MERDGQPDYSHYDLRDFQSRVLDDIKANMVAQAELKRSLEELRGAVHGLTRLLRGDNGTPEAIESSLVMRFYVLEREFKIFQDRAQKHSDWGWKVAADVAQKLIIAAIGAIAALLYARGAVK
jgi:hypothetical protein